MLVKEMTQRHQTLSARQIAQISWYIDKVYVCSENYLIIYYDILWMLCLTIIIHMITLIIHITTLPSSCWRPPFSILSRSSKILQEKIKFIKKSHKILNYLCILQAKIIVSNVSIKLCFCFWICSSTTIPPVFLTWHVNLHFKRA